MLTLCAVRCGAGWHTFFIINTVVVQVSWLCAMLMNPGYVELPVDARDSRGKGIRSSSTDDMKSVHVVHRVVRGGRCGLGTHVCVRCSAAGKATTSTCWMLTPRMRSKWPLTWRHRSTMVRVRTDVGVKLTPCGADDESAPAATHVHNPLAPVSYDEALERGVADHLCVSCRLVKPLRSKHCSTCKR